MYNFKFFPKTILVTFGFLIVLGVLLAFSGFGEILIVLIYFQHIYVAELLEKLIGIKLLGERSGSWITIAINYPILVLTALIDLAITSVCSYFVVRRFVKRA